MNNRKVNNTTMIKGDGKTNSVIKEFSELGLVLSVEDVSNILQISRVSAYELIHTEGFPVLYVGRRIKIPRSAFANWLDRQVTGTVK